MSAAYSVHSVWSDEVADGMALKLLTCCAGNTMRASGVATGRMEACSLAADWAGSSFWSRVLDSIDRFGS